MYKHEQIVETFTLSEKLITNMLLNFECHMRCEHYQYN